MKKRGAGRQALAHGVVLGLGGRLALARRRADQRDVVAEVERHAARAAPQRAGADPHELAARAQLVHPGRRVGADAARQHVALPRLDRQRQALERHERLAQAVDARAGGGMAVDALPGREEAGERALVGRLDLLAQGGERRAAQAPQHLGVAPLALGAARPQLAAHQLAGALELAQRGGGVDAVALAQLGRRERAVRLGVAAHQPRERVGDVRQERLGQAAGRHRAERVAVEPGVLGGDPALLAADAQADRAALALELGEHRVRVNAREHARAHLVGGQVAEPAQHVVQRVAGLGLRALGAVLEVGLDLLERVGVDQVAQLLLAEQLAQQVAVERQRRRAPLGVGRVALVHVGRDVVEQQRGGEGRRRLRLDLDQRQLAAVQRAQQLLEPGEVEHVAQALAVGLEHDRELAVAPRDLEQGLRLQALLPQRRAPARVGARDQQRAGRVLAEARAEQRRAAQLADDQVLELVGVGTSTRSAPGRLVGVGQVDDDPVVGPDRVGLEAELVADARRQRQAPGGVDAAAVGRQDAQPPVADLVAEALDHDRAVAGDHARRLLLLAQEVEQVVGRARVEVVVALERLGGLVDRPARERADRLAQLLRPPDAVALPERHRAGHARGRA